MRRVVAAIVVAFVACLPFAFAAPPALAHAALRTTDPAADSAVDAAPTTVRLSFSEEPEPSLSDIRVVDTTGATHHVGRAQPAADDPLSLVVGLEPLEHRVYTVVWRVVSRVDGHPTAGAYAFGVGVSPTAQALADAARTDSPAPSRHEMAARWILVLGLVALLGAAVAGAAHFGGPAGRTVLASGGWAASALGLLLLADWQRRAADVSFSALRETSIGRALVWRGLAIGVAGLALVGARRPSLRRPALGLAAAAASAAMAAHVAAGHAAGGSTLQWTRVAAQWAHFVAVGIWVGGLAALLLGVRGEPSKAKAAAVRRFSAVAATTFAVVVATGIVRTVNELSTWGDLASTGYGRAVVLKSGLLLAMLGLAAVNRRRSVPAAEKNLRPLRRLSAGEVGLGVAALAAAAVLATLTPPASMAADAPAITVTGADATTSVRVRLVAQAAAPGPNRFAVRAVDYDSGRTIPADGVTLRFQPIDDPGVAPTTLALRRDPDGGSWVATGSNLALDGRWRVTVLVERGSRSVAVPLEVHVQGAPQFLSVERIPGRPVRYLVQLTEGKYVRVRAEPGRVAGPNRLHAEFVDDFGEELPIDTLVVTSTPDDGETRQHATRRLTAARFVADVDLPADRRTTLAVVARSPEGIRWRATVELDAPSD